MDPAAYKDSTRVMNHIYSRPPPPPPSIPEEQTSRPMGVQPQSEESWIYDTPMTKAYINREGPNSAGAEKQTQQTQAAPPIADAHEIDRAGGMPWMSATQQQPLMWDNETTGNQNEATPCLSKAPYPYGSLSLPQPSLNLDFRMSVTLNPRIDVGVTPFGQRNWISFSGGSWSGSWGSGIVLPGGQDIQVNTPTGTHMETNYMLLTLDNPPAHIMVSTNGWRTGPPEILAQLADPKQADQVDPNSYKFRLFVNMETGDERYREKINRGMWIGSGMRLGNEVVYDAYRIS